MYTEFEIRLVKGEGRGQVRTLIEDPPHIFEEEGVSASVPSSGRTGYVTTQKRWYLNRRKRMILRVHLPLPRYHSSKLDCRHIKRPSTAPESPCMAFVIVAVAFLRQDSTPRTPQSSEQFKIALFDSSAAGPWRQLTYLHTYFVHTRT